MDMPGRGLYDERDSGIARSGRLMRLGGKAWIDLHSKQLSALHLMHLSFEFGFTFILVMTKEVKEQKSSSFIQGVIGLLDYTL